MPLLLVCSCILTRDVLIFTKIYRMKVSLHENFQIYGSW